MSPDDAFIYSPPNSFSWIAQKGFIHKAYFIVLLTLYVGSSVSKESLLFSFIQLLGQSWFWELDNWWLDTRIVSVLFDHLCPRVVVPISIKN